MQKKITLIFILLCSFSFVNAQQDYGEGSGPFNPGVNGYTIGSTTDNTYSALLINGPLLPSWGTCTRDIVFKFRSAGKSIIRSYRGGSWDTYLQFLTTPTAGQKPLVRMHIDQCGYIGIGTTTPASLLSVNGDVRAKGVIVTLENWADFVFEDDYELPSLDEVASHIKENKHLPGIPTAKEIEEAGVNLGEMNVKLLQKIEELTLYMIDLKEENLEIKKQLEEFKTLFPVK